jgi:hypothetical protein
VPAFGYSLPEIECYNRALLYDPPVLTYRYEYLTRSLGLRAPPASFC